MNNISIRIANLEDAEKLLEIYEPYVVNTAITFEYEVPTLEEFRKRMATLQEKYPYLVAESDGNIVGYTYAGPFKSRPAYGWAVEVSIYVAQKIKRLIRLQSLLA